MDRLCFTTPSLPLPSLPAFAVTPHLSHDRAVSHILTDSRSLLMPEETLFFAIRTESGDGHRYIESLYERGVRSFVVEQLSSETEAKYSGCNWYVVTSSITALQALARTHRERFPLLHTIGITGSNGKTVVKELLYQLLSPCSIRCARPVATIRRSAVPLLRAEYHRYGRSRPHRSGDLPPW